MNFWCIIGKHNMTWNENKPIKLTCERCGKPDMEYQRAYERHQRSKE